MPAPRRIRGPACASKGSCRPTSCRRRSAGARPLLMTPKWVEAFGNVAIEAMACGVPVIAYRRGGPAEIVVDGETGFLVEPDDVDGMVAAVGRIDEIDRARAAARSRSTGRSAPSPAGWRHG